MASRADGKVVINTQLNNSGFKKGVAGLAGSLGGLQGVLCKIGTAVGAAFAVKKLIDFGRAAIELGSNVAEVQNVVDVAFGAMAYKIEAFADTSIEQFGMSKLSAKKTASTYMAMARGMGIAEDQASDMAIAITGLTGDVASFYNINQSLADTKLKSIFTGETETLKDLGVVMTQANLDAYALANGFGKTTAQMSQQELVMLRYRYVTEQLSLAQGDFARTSSSWANQTRILSERWQEFMSIVGQALITVLTPALQVLNSIVSALISMANTFNAAVTSMFGGTSTQLQQTQSAAASVGAAISDSVDQQNDLTKATKETAKAQNTLGIDELNVVNQGAAGGSTGGAAGTLAGGIDVIEKPPVEEKASKGVELLTRAFNALYRSIIVIKNGFTSFYTAVLGPFIDRCKEVGLVILEWLVEKLEALADWLEAHQEEVSQFITILGTLGLITAIVIGLITAFKLLGSVMTAVLSSPLAIIALIVAALTGIVIATGNGQAAIDALKNVLDGFLTFVEGIFSGNMDLAMQGLEQMFQGLLDFCLVIFSSLDQAFGACLDWIVQKLGVSNKSILGLVDGLKQIFHGVTEFLSGVFSGDWSRAWEGLTGIFKGVVNGLISLFEGFINLIPTGLNWLIDKINTLAFDIPDWPIFGSYAGQRFGFNFPHVGTFSLPRLAQGAVIPANREFLAVLGDQKHGTNIEAPADLIRQMVMEGIAAMGMTDDQDININLTIPLDGEVMYKGMIKVKRQRGRELIANPSLV